MLGRRAPSVTIAVVLLLLLAPTGCSTTSSRASAGERRACRMVARAPGPTEELADAVERSGDDDLASHAAGIRRGDQAAFDALTSTCIERGLYDPLEG